MRGVSEQEAYKRIVSASNPPSESKISSLWPSSLTALLTGELSKASRPTLFGPRPIKLQLLGVGHSQCYV